MYLYNTRFARFVVAFGALLVCLALTLLAAHAASQFPGCLLIDTNTITELLDPATFHIHTFKFPSFETNDGSPEDYAYSPDGTHVAIMRGTAANDLTVETLSHPYPISTFRATFNIIDSIPPTVIAWSPDSQWVAVESNVKTQSLTIMDAAGHSQHTISFGAKSNYFTMAWSGDSQFLLTQFVPENGLNAPTSIALYHIPDLKQIDLGAAGGIQIGTCFWNNWNCWAAGTAKHRLAYAAPVPGQPNAATLVLLDAVAPILKAIPIPQTGEYSVVGIDPNGSHVAVAQDVEVPIDSDNPDPISVPLWIYEFDSGRGVHVADVADTVYQTRGQMGGQLLFPEIAWSANGDTLYYIAYANNNLSMQLWAYQPATQRNWQIASWSMADSPYGYAFYISPDNQHVVLSATPHWQSRVQLIVLGAGRGKIVNLMADGHSSPWSPDSRYIAVGHLDENASTLSVTVFDQNGIAIGHTAIENMVDEFFDFTWTACQLP